MCSLLLFLLQIFLILPLVHTLKINIKCKNVGSQENYGDMLHTHPYMLDKLYCPILLSFLPLFNKGYNI